MLTFAVIAGIMGYLTAVARRESEKRARIEAALAGERDQFHRVLDRMQEGVRVIGPDYRIRYVNAAMKRDSGQAVGSYCYKYLRGLDAPCPQVCKLPVVLAGQVERWEHRLPNRGRWEVLASPYRDADGVVCQLTILTKTARPGEAQGPRLRSARPPTPAKIGIGLDSVNPG